MENCTDLCRCCLSSNCKVSLLDNHVSKKFQDITNIEVIYNEGLPEKLCGNCYESMNSAYYFRKQCLKMNNSLRKQLEESLMNDDIEDYETVKDDFGNDPEKQLESIIKKEIKDPDDDVYYVLVIDDQNKQMSVKAITDKSFQHNNPTTSEPEMLITSIKKETIDHVNESVLMSDDQNFGHTIDSFLVNDRVPDNVPATILENEEENDENNLDEPMAIDDIHDSQDSTSQSNDLPIFFNNIGDISKLNSLPESNRVIKIVTASGRDGTILLDSDNKVTYLTDTQLAVANGDDEMNQEEVILCEGDDTSQYQILKCDGSELVIEYADEDQISTVLQQEDGTFLCECGLSFEDLADYEEHQYKHNLVGENLCNLCGKGFETAEILTGHMLLHNVSDVLVMCPFCNQLIKRGVLTQHIKHGHNSVKPQCKICLKTFANPNNLKRHLMIHAGIREFECDICFKRFCQKITMQTHRLTHVDPFSCKECYMTFENKEGLQEHIDSKKCTKSKVEQIKDELIKKVKKELNDSGGKLVGYACTLCKKMFSVESALDQHIDETHVKYQITDPAELLCKECGEIMPSKKAMNSHILLHKNVKSKNSKKFECFICEKSCASQAMLAMHERVHTNERPFPCHLCSLRFKTKTHLRTHQLTHTREKRYGCSICMKFFALKGNLVVHMRIHTGEKPYPCATCGEAFIDSKYLRKHMLKKHSLDEAGNPALSDEKQDKENNKTYTFF